MTEKNTFRAVVLEVGKDAEVRNIERTKEAVESILNSPSVVGLIYLADRPNGRLFIAVHENGQVQSLPRNRIDLRGNAIILKISKEEQTEIDLTDEECQKLLEEIRTWP